MKFDSYTRFLKSPLYQECILAEVEGRSLPDPQQVPSSPASKHSVSSDHSNVSTPKKVPRPARVLRREPLCRVSGAVPGMEPRGRGSSRCLWTLGGPVPPCRAARTSALPPSASCCVLCGVPVTSRL